MKGPKFISRKKKISTPITRKNQVFRLNQFLGQKPIIAIAAIGLNLFFFFLLNWFVNLLSHLSELIAALRTGDSVEIPFFSIHSWQACIAILILLGIFDCILIYKMHNSFGDITHDLKGSAHFELMGEIRKQYPAIPGVKETFPGTGGFPVAEEFLRPASAEKLFANLYESPDEKETYLKARKNKRNNLSRPWSRVWHKENPIFVIYIDKSDVNAFIIGMTRSGKGELTVIAIIDIYSRAEKQASLVITDPKLELAPMSYQTLINRGYNVRVLNLQQLMYSVGYNPLYMITNAYKAGDIALAELLCNSLAFSIYKANDEGGTTSSSEKYFDDNSTAALTATILALIDDCLELDKENNNLRKRHFKLRQKIFSELDETQQKKAKIFQCIYSLLPDYDAEPDYFKIANKATEILGFSVTAKQVSAYSMLLRVYHLHMEKNVSLKDLLESNLLPFSTEEELSNTIGFCYFFLNLQTDTAVFEEIHKFEKCINMYSVQIFFSSLAKIKHTRDGSVTELDVYFQSRKRKDGLPDRAAVNYASIEVTSDRTKTSIFSSMLTSLRIFSMESVAKLTVENTIDLQEIGFGDKPSAIFLAVPDYDSSLYFLASFFIGQLSYVLADSAAKSPDGKCERQVVFNLDEIGNFPRIFQLGHYVTVGLSRGMRYNLYLQDIPQFIQLYGEDEAKKIMGNCSNHLYILTGNSETAQTFSDELGEETVLEVTRSGSKLSLNKTYTEQALSKPLLNKNQLMELAPGETVLIRRTYRTDLKGNHIRPRPIFNTSDPEYRYLGTQRFQYRYEYLNEDFPDDNRAFKTIQDLVETREHIDLKEYLFNMDIYFNRKAAKEWSDTKLGDTTFGQCSNTFTSLLPYTKAELENFTVQKARKVLEAFFDEGKLTPTDYKRLNTILDEKLQKKPDSEASVQTS